MPLFFFPLQTPAGLERDDSGLNYPDAAVAYLEACKAIPGLSAELLSNRCDAMACAFVIANEEDVTLMEVPFTEGLRRRRPRSASVSKVVTSIERAQNLAADLRDLNAEALRRVAALRMLLADGKPNAEEAS